MTPTTTSGAVKTFLGDGSLNDSLLVQLINAVSSQIYKFLGRDLDWHAGYTQILSGYNSVKINLKSTPVHTIQNVWKDGVGSFGQAEGAFGDSSLLRYGVDYALQYDDTDFDGNPVSKSGLLVRLNGVWGGSALNVRGLLGRYSTQANGNLKIVYDGGYKCIPPDVALAAHLTISRILNSKNFGGMLVQSGRLGEASYSLASGMIKSSNMLEAVRPLLIPYRRLTS